MKRKGKESYVLIGVASEKVSVEHTRREGDGIAAVGVGEVGKPVEEDGTATVRVSEEVITALVLSPDDYQESTQANCKGEDTMHHRTGGTGIVIELESGVIDRLAG